MSLERFRRTRMVVLTRHSMAYQAARAMADNHIGSVLVSAPQGLAGMITDRDLALGVLGAVVGLVAALSDLSDIEKLGHAISGAFIATLFGIFTGYVLWFPFATKLKQKSASEIQLYEMMIEGILSIQNGESPKNLEDKLLVYLTPKERANYEAEKEAA